MMTEAVSATGTSITNGRINHCPVINATVPSVAPSASEPVSPMNISAGCALYHRKANDAPTTVKQNRSR